MFILILLPLIVALIISYIIAEKFEAIAFQKGYNSSIHSFAMCFWLGIVGYLYVIALPDLTIRQANAQQSQASVKSVEESDACVCETGQAKLEKEEYDKLVKMAERYKDPFFDINLRIRTYESVVKKMEIFANNNFEDSAIRLKEYRSYLESLKAQI